MWREFHICRGLAITISSQMMRCVPQSSWPSWEWASVLHALFEVTKTTILRAESAVRPQSTTWATTAYKVTAKTRFPTDFRSFSISVATKVLSVPLGASEKKKRCDRIFFYVAVPSRFLINTPGACYYPVSLVKLFQTLLRLWTQQFYPEIYIIPTFV